ncbi:hypothetical protein PGTUg99_014113 [Puccinia graminis f. sp. tritici]|uniref:Uncharacterized protein n=1 Tax=Puccinia graminis f. sp. tritici TaxID=56615 RepID=A0A5B0M981_PUCGR|nr:hypothetical protein PGTUg99_014113 [Puccinia graminis f. sp. tritici]
MEERLNETSAAILHERRPFVEPLLHRLGPFVDFTKGPSLNTAGLLFFRAFSTPHQARSQLLRQSVMIRDK